MVEYRKGGERSLPYRTVAVIMWRSGLASEASHRPGYPRASLGHCSAGTITKILIIWTKKQLLIFICTGSLYKHAFLDPFIRFCLHRPGD